MKGRRTSSVSDIPWSCSCMGVRFSIPVNEIDLVCPPQPMPRFLVGRAVWKPRPDFSTATEAWLVVGGSHHTALSRALGAEVVINSAEMAGIELLVIGAATTIPAFEHELRWGAAYHRLARGL